MILHLLTRFTEEKKYKMGRKGVSFLYIFHVSYPYLTEEEKQEKYLIFYNTFCRVKILYALIHFILSDIRYTNFPFSSQRRWIKFVPIFRIYRLFSLHFICVFVVYPLKQVFVNKIQRQMKRKRQYRGVFLSLTFFTSALLLVAYLNKFLFLSV